MKKSVIFLCLSIFLSHNACKQAPKQVSIAGEPAFTIPGVEASDFLKGLEDKDFHMLTDFETNRSRWIAKKGTDSGHVFVMLTGSANKEITSIEVSIRAENYAGIERFKWLMSDIAGVPASEGSEWLENNFRAGGEVTLEGCKYELDSSSRMVKLEIEGQEPK